MPKAPVSSPIWVWRVAVGGALQSIGLGTHIQILHFTHLKESCDGVGYMGLADSRFSEIGDWAGIRVDTLDR